MKNKMMRKGILMGLLIFLCISNVAAFAVSSSYWSGNPLKLSPGESKNFSIILQNLGGTSDLTLKAKISSGSEILKIIDSSEIYTVPAGNKTEVNFEAVMPSDAEPGKTYDAKIDFSEVKQSSSGEFGFGSAIGQGFSIIVLSPTGEAVEGNNLIIVYVIAGIIILLAIIAFLAKKFIHKKRSVKKN